MTAKTRAAQIKLILFDVDGVLTDGRIYLFPAPAAASSEVNNGAEAKADAGGFAIASPSYMECKSFHAHDGTAFSLARLGGLKTGLVTKRISETVRLRARDLRVDHLCQGAQDKAATVREILAKEGLKPEQMAFVGDDIIDLPAMRLAGLAVAVANAREEVKDEAHIVTDHMGGEGAARDAIEYILKAKGVFDKSLIAYIEDRSPNVGQ
jgi:3-deoxy-D-manno-octulosonate 8-phosphate phosphatase (KDO 8-P phosphatase)